MITGLILFQIREEEEALEEQLELDDHQAGDFCKDDQLGEEDVWLRPSSFSNIKDKIIPPQRLGQ